MSETISILGCLEPCPQCGSHFVFHSTSHDLTGDLRSRCLQCLHYWESKDSLALAKHKRNVEQANEGRRVASHSIQEKLETIVSGIGGGK